MSTLLAADVGGTNARFALVSSDGKVLSASTLESRRYARLEDALRDFLRGRPAPVAGCVAIAGPVVDGRCVATNLPWVVDTRSLASAGHLRHVALLNDLVAQAIGASRLAARDVEPIWGTARPRRTGANLAVIAPGTGLGEAALVWDGRRHVPLATEGGHADFAPRNELEFELLEYLKARFRRRISYERIVSGPGLGNVYDFFVEAKGVSRGRTAAKRIAAAVDRNAEIARLGAAGESPAAERALELFLDVYGAEAGNLLLKTFATGGVLLVGGITGALLDPLRKSAFRRSFCDKGRLSHLLEAAPVAYARGKDLGLRGAALFAAQIAREEGIVRAPPATKKPRG